MLDTFLGLNTGIDSSCGSGFSIYVSAVKE